MVNREKVYEVPLAGAGFVRKSHGSAYAPGEYRVMRNCEILKDGTIHNRRPIRAVTSSGSNDPATVNMRNIRDFIGHYKSTVITGGRDSHKWHAYGGINNLWSPATMNALNHEWVAGDGSKITNTATDWRMIVGFFKYNKICYWLIQSYIAARSTDGHASSMMHIVYFTEPANGDISTITFANVAANVFRIYMEDLNTVVLTPFDATDKTASTGADKLRSPGIFSKFQRFFIFKDRLWILTHKTLLFSKATDPTIWTTPDGGFFNFNEDEVNDAAAYRDSIYIVCDNRTYALTYATDPNSITDVRLRLLTDGVGGDSCVLFRGGMYFARDDGLYSITDQTVEKVVDLRFYHDYNADNALKYSWKLVVFGNYIVLMARTWERSTAALGPGDITGSRYPSDVPARWPNIPDYYEYCATQPLADVDLIGSNINFNSVFFLNMDNGAVHTFDSVGYGFVQDMYFCPVEDSLGLQRMFISYVRGPVLSSTGGNAVGHYIYYMNLTQDDIVESVAYDSTFTSGSLIKNTGFVVDLEFLVDIDGDEFWVKRFRQIMFEASFPPGFSLVYQYDNEAYALGAIDVGGTLPADELIAPYAIRANMNQKARQVFVRLYKPYNLITTDPFDDGNFSFLTINRIIVTYSESNRAPTRSTGAAISS